MNSLGNRMKRKLKWCLSHKDSLLPKSRKKSEKWETKRWSRGVWVLWQIKTRNGQWKRKQWGKNTSQRVWVCAYAVSRKWHEKNWWEKLFWSGWQILGQQINWTWRPVWEWLDFKWSSQIFGCRHLQLSFRLTPHCKAVLLKVMDSPIHSSFKQDMADLVYR